MAENTRNLQEARRAVAAAAKDRGWNNPPQQRQGKSTSAYPRKGKGSPFSFSKGKSAHYATDDLAWMKGGKKGYPKGDFSGKNKGMMRSFKGPPKGSNDIHFLNEHHMFTLNEEVYAEIPEELAGSEAIVDTGATASAGGHWAVQSLCKAVMKEIPSATMEIYTGARPWFRYGSGKWGQTLY